MLIGRDVYAPVSNHVFSFSSERAILLLVLQAWEMLGRTQQLLVNHEFLSRKVLSIQSVLKSASVIIMVLETYGEFFKSKFLDTLIRNAIALSMPFATLRKKCKFDVPHCAHKVAAQSVWPPLNAREWIIQRYAVYLIGSVFINFSFHLITPEHRDLSWFFYF